MVLVSAIARILSISITIQIVIIYAIVSSLLN